MSQAPQPLLRGSLRQTPLAELLVHIYDRKLEGTLLLQTAERKKSAVLFTRGAPSKARPAEQNVFLSEVAVDLGLIPPEVSRATLERASTTSILHGQILLEGGHLDESGLYVALREQLKRQVLQLCELPDTTGFGFFPINYLADWGHAGSWRVKPLPMLWRALVDHLPGARRDAWLDKLGDLPLRLRREAPVSRYALTAKENAVVDMLRALPEPVQQLLRSGVGSEELVRNVVCALFLSRQLDTGTAEAPVGLHEPPETPNSVPPRESRASQRSMSVPRWSQPPKDLDAGTVPETPPAEGEGRSTHTRTATSPRRSITASRRPPAGDAAALRAEIEEYLERKPQNYYEVLRLERGASSAEVRAAFFQLAKRWHPDRLPAELADLRPQVNQAFATMGEAHQTLMDDGKRAEYDSAIDDAPDDEQEQVATILRAASAHQRAEVLMKKKDMAGALREATEAYELDPSQTDHLALYVWLRSLQDKEVRLAESIGMLDRALKASPEHIKALWYRGQLLKKANQNMKAMRDFKKIIELKPRHVDAARELRVFSMRRRSDPGAGNSSPKAGGLFGFRKK